MMRSGKLLLTAALLGAVFLITAGIIGSVPARADTDTTPPSIPAAPSATLAANQTQVAVSWTASTDDTAVTGYYLYRNGGLIANTADVSFAENLSPGVYSYTVAAYDAAGNVSARSNQSSLVSVVSDTTPPSAPASLTATAATSSVVLSWSASTDNVGVVGYYLYKNGNKLSLSGIFTATTYTDTGLIPGNTFNYAVVAYDAAGNNSTARVVNVTTIADIAPPSTVGTPSAVSKSSAEIDLSWPYASDNVGVVGYHVYRGDSLVTSVSGNSYHDIGLSPQTTYSYYLTAYDAAGNVSGASFPATATTFAPDVTPPTTPYYFAGKAISSSEIDLLWWASSDDIGIGGYRLYRSGTLIVDTTSTAYRDVGLATSTAYAYALEGYDTSGNVSPQASVSATTLATAAVVSPTTTTPLATGGSGGTSSGGLGASITASLYYGLRNDMVRTLQTILIGLGYLGSDYATGFYGSLTQGGVQKFQCAKAIVCSGSPASTGWGSVGPKTKKVLNGL
jgi:chitodextrinase